METIEQLKKENEELKRRMGIGEDDPAKDGYIVLVNILRQQNKYLRDVKISELITSDDSAKKVEYKNAKELWEGLTKLIQSVSTLKIELKMEGEEKKISYKPISSRTIADEEEDV